MKKCIYIFGIIVLLSACTGLKRLDFTQPIRQKIESNNISLAQVQYYIDNQLMLAREINSESAKLFKGGILFENGKYYETVTFPRNVAGVCVGATDNILNITFENDDTKYLQFALQNDGTYKLVNGNPSYSTISKILYDNKEYFLNYKGNRPGLLIKRSDVNDTNNERRVIKGRKIA